MSNLLDEALVPTLPLSDQRSKIERDGLHDGALGQTWREYKSILEQRAKQIAIDERCRVEKLCEAQKAELALAQETETRVRAETSRVEKDYEMVAGDRDRRPSTYSFVWGLGFVLLAFLLVAADFPLTRQIVSAMSIGSDDAWTMEQILVAGGIVVISLFFKLLADPFTQPRYLMSPLLRGVVQALSILIAVVILVGVIGTLYLLGMFRADAIASDANVATAEETFSVSAPSSTDTSTTVQGTGSAPPPPTNTLERLRDFTFVVLGLTLPIIGGIFASVGMARIHNSERLKNLTKERSELRTNLDVAARAARTWGAAVQSLNHDLTAIKSRLAAASGDMHEYLHAYQTGYCIPERELGRVGMATRLRDVVANWTAIVSQSQNLVRTEAVSDDAGREHTNDTTGSEIVQA